MAPRLDDRMFHHLGGHLAVAHRRIQRADEASLVGSGLSNAQARVIRTLDRLDRPLLMSELATVLDIVPRSATSVVDELEPMGLVERRPDPTDRRGVRVSLTDEGRSIAPGLRDQHGRAVASVFTQLSSAEVTLLADLLQRVAHTEPG